MSGLWKRYVRPDRTIDVAAWKRAVESGEVVGACGCGGFLRAEVAPYMNDGSRVEWMLARCARCDSEYASPNGRLARPKR